MQSFLTSCLCHAARTANSVQHTDPFYVTTALLFVSMLLFFGYSCPLPYDCASCKLPWFFLGCACFLGRQQRHFLITNAIWALCLLSVRHFFSVAKKAGITIHQQFSYLPSPDNSLHIFLLQTPFKHFLVTYFSSIPINIKLFNPLSSCLSCW